jgi:hypothetical protein
MRKVFVLILIGLIGILFFSSVSIQDKRQGS